MSYRMSLDSKPGKKTHAWNSMQLFCNNNERTIFLLQSIFHAVKNNLLIFKLTRLEHYFINHSNSKLSCLKIT